MTKYVKSRVIESTPPAAPKALSVVPKGPSPTGPSQQDTMDPEPAPIIDVLVRLIDRAYGIRTGRPARVGRLLNVAI